MNNLLNSIVENTMEGTLKHEVAEILVDHVIDCNSDAEIMDSINDILNNGCISGIVSAMVYLKDTEAFFNKYANEIFELMNDECFDFTCFEYSKNNLAWWAFEIVTSYIYNELEIALEF